MKVITDGIDIIIDFLKESNFNEKKFKDYISSPQMKIFLKHEKRLKRDTNKKKIKNELKRVFLNEKYDDDYGFSILKRNIVQLEKDINYIKENEREIFERVCIQVYEYLPKNIEVDPNIIIYLGGFDGGFATFTKDVYVNIGRYIGNLKEFEKLLAHECYHARKIPFKRKVSLFFKMSFYPEKAMYDTLGRILEEGIACLVQHGVNFCNDDPIGTLTSRDMLLSKEYFEILNESLLSIKNENPDYNLICKINPYVLGYIISKTIYKHKGIVVLNEWTINFNYKDPIKTYIDICRDKDISSGFSTEVEEWLYVISK
ncbi:hypothetical protein FYJ27_04610 [Anaerosalibacter bizertensis]|uniref:DUF2268 domain-containing protein n=1 Tax=Anaerosalibacter bizertensis TaxID=932217 RepID=A0A844FGB7_9FIRM|nr:DUF5700 domain-containing putative Zn-dependent protease [Anaerosalibacter bizertensis]MBV1818806.1 hypothetical protein [Bacteroidales bacterium MSK.15.36]HHV26720.1 hypothetical protein [Tissierellia bacterium]MBU5292650.1 hypothetical protein [Anaerosalibacter bizertensis]MCB5559105.1 hypothetical protein [Anaerosalibacter bizertensis]MCG4565108.1 hypothetical protein [Anaerosalibacter bizertensis]